MQETQGSFDLSLWQFAISGRREREDELGSECLLRDSEAEASNLPSAARSQLPMGVDPYRDPTLVNILHLANPQE